MSAWRGRYLTLTGVDETSDLPFVTRAFVPDPLPAAPTLSTGTWTAVVEAHDALGRLAEQLRRDPRGVRLLLAVEAAAAEQLAGGLLSAPEALRLWREDGLPVAARAASGLQHVPAGDARDLLRHALEALGTTLRDDHAWISPSGGDITTATYVAPPAGPDVAAGVEAWADWCDSVTLPAVVRASLSHLQLESLRPARQANGSLARLVLAAQLTAQLPVRALPVSAALLRDRPAYAAVLDVARRESTFDAVVDVVAGAARAAADDASDVLAQATGLVDDGVARLRDSGVRGTAVDIAADLADHPVVTASTLAQRHDVAFQTANVAIDRLVEHGLLLQLNEGHYDRVFGASEILELVADAQPDPSMTDPPGDPGR